MAIKRVLRWSLWAVASAALGTRPVQAQDGTLSSPPKEERRPTQLSIPHFGVLVGAGVPDGANASAVYRPFTWLRTEAGGSYNMVSKGVRGGISIIPFGIGPSASLEAGHTFEGNANGIARALAGGGFADKAVLQRIGYDYANLHLGLDFGMQRAVFFIHAGMSYVRATVHNVNTQIADAMSSTDTTVTFSQDPVVRIWTPSAKLGLIIYFR